MRNNINIEEIIYKEFTKQKNIENLNLKPKFEKEFIESLNEKQKKVYENIILGIDYEYSMQKRELIQFVLDFVSAVNKTRDNTRLYFD